MSITVVGSEKVNNIDCYIVEIKSATGEAGSATYWVSKESNPRTLKYKLIIAEMGGATMTGILKKIRLLLCSIFFFKFITTKIQNYCF